MSWKSEFPYTILHKGADYYNRGFVEDFKKTDQFCSAVVYGSRPYSVVVYRPGSEQMDMKCTCPFARRGENCKHMAAVMYKWDEVTKKEKIENGLKKDPFPRAPLGQEPYYQIADIADGYNITNDDYETALRLADEEIVRISDIRSKYKTFLRTEHREARFKIEGLYRAGNKGSAEISVEFDSKELLDYSCSVCGKNKQNYYYSYYDNEYESRFLCSHITALLILADRYTKLMDPGDATDYKANNFLGTFMKARERQSFEEHAESGTVVLEPRVLEKNYGYELNFRIGNGGKMFVVKNLTDLYDTVREGKVMSLGKNAKIDFELESFDESSEELYSLIERDVKKARAIDIKNKSTHYYAQPSAETGKGIPFVGDVIDTIYHQMYGKLLDFKDKDSKTGKSLRVLDIDPEVVVNITGVFNSKGASGAPAKKKKFNGLRVEGWVPAALDGIKSRYFIADGYLSRIDEETWQRIKAFDDAASDYDQTFDFIVGSKMATEFYYRILPQLREDPVFTISEEDGLLQHIAPEAEFEFYLDSADGDILGKARVIYGDEGSYIKPLHLEKLPLPKGRDVNQEFAVRNVLDELFEDYDEEDESFIISDSDDARYDFLKYGISRLLAYGEVNSTDAFSRMRIRRTPVVQIGVSVESDLLDLKIMTRDMDEEELLELLQSYRLKKRYHKLKNGEYVDLEEQASLDTLMRMFESMGVPLKDFVKGKMQIPAYRALYLEKMLEDHEDMVAARDRTFRSLIKNFKTINDSDYEVPEQLKDVLRGYQDKGYKWLKTLETAGFGGILADDMGLGKTLQLITLIAGDKEEGLEPTALVVCPASLVYNWIEEINRFTPELKAVAVAGTKSQRRQIIEQSDDYDFLITSYDYLKRDVDLYEGKRFTHQILDEAQYIKNARAAASRSVKLIHADHRFALTGTPIENRLSELWSIFDFLMPGFLYNYEKFRIMFETPVTKNKDERKTQMLKNMVSPFLLRRKKADVLKDLPDKLEEFHYAVFGKKQQEIYDGQVVRLRDMVEGGSENLNTERMRILAELTRIRQICCDPHLIYSDYDGDSAKREACIDLINSACDGDHKVLLFSQFTSMLDLLEADMDREKISYYKITGQTPKEERIKLVRAFNTDDTQVFLISLKAGGTGLNLTGADVVIHYDPWWNLAAQDQATDRAHRIGQTRNVTVYKLIAKGSIEEKIVKMQETKRELADAVLSGETRSLGTMTREELLELLG